MAGILQTFTRHSGAGRSAGKILTHWIPAYAGMTVSLVISLLAPPVHAQSKDNWPARPVRLVHGFISGGSVDITARLLAAHLTESLGQQVIVDGRPGAGGTTGAAIVAKSDADGYTLFLM